MALVVTLAIACPVGSQAADDAFPPPHPAPTATPAQPATQANWTTLPQPVLQADLATQAQPATQADLATQAPAPQVQPATLVEPVLAPVSGLFGEPLREADSFADSALPRLPGRRMWHDKVAPADEEEAACSPEFPLYSYQGAGHDQAVRWVIGNGNGMGIFSLDMDNGQSAPNGDPFFSIHPDFAIHWVSGPRATDMPARLYDLLIRFQHSFALNDVWRYDISATIGYYTDFEGSARRGLRWPATAVLYCRPIPTIDFFGGVDILDRDDLFCLPVGGVTWQPNSKWRFDFAFPKPRVAYRTGGSEWLYLAGDIGGGSWAIERQSGDDDIATYRDYRIEFGSMDTRKNTRIINQCYGIAFDRHLEYRSQAGTFEPGATIYWRWTCDY